MSVSLHSWLCAELRQRPDKAGKEALHDLCRSVHSSYIRGARLALGLVALLSELVFCTRFCEPGGRPIRLAGAAGDEEARAGAARAGWDVLLLVLDVGLVEGSADR